MEELNEGWRSRAASDLTAFARYALCSAERLGHTFLSHQGSNTVRAESLCLINKLEVQLFNVIILFNFFLAHVLGHSSCKEHAV